MPVADKFYVATQTRTIRGGSKQGTAAFNQVIGAVKPKSLVVIEEVIPSGSSFWIKIKFNETRFAN